MGTDIEGFLAGMGMSQQDVEMAAAKRHLRDQFAARMQMVTEPSEAVLNAELNRQEQLLNKEVERQRFAKMTNTRYPGEVIRVPRKDMTPQQIAALRYYTPEEVLDHQAGLVKVGDKWYDFVGRDGHGHNNGDWLDEGQMPRTERSHTRIDDTLAAWIAAPFWALAWVLTAGKFGRLMWETA